MQERTVMVISSKWKRLGWFRGVIINNASIYIKINLGFLTQKNLDCPIIYFISVPLDSPASYPFLRAPVFFLWCQMPQFFPLQRTQDQHLTRMWFSAFGLLLFPKKHHYQGLSIYVASTIISCIFIFSFSLLFNIMFLIFIHAFTEC